MTQEEIITKAFEKVGWAVTPTRLWEATKNQSWLFSHAFLKAFFGEKLITMKRIGGDMLSSLVLIKEGSETSVPFIHSKAYRLSERVHAEFYCNQITLMTGNLLMYMWQYHATMMVLEDEPLEYLEKFL